jgi:hypothetical protein
MLGLLVLREVKQLPAQQVFVLNKRSPLVVLLVLVLKLAPQHAPDLCVPRGDIGVVLLLRRALLGLFYRVTFYLCLSFTQLDFEGLADGCRLRFIPLLLQWDGMF